MGLNITSLAARPQLAKHLIAQHLVLAIPPEAQQELLDGQSAAVPTAAASSGSSSNHSILVVSFVNNTQQQGQQQQQLDQLAGRVKVTDSQGQVATATKLVRLDANKLALVVDKVLQSGKCWSVDVCRHWLICTRPHTVALVVNRVLESSFPCCVMLSRVALHNPHFASLCKHKASQAGLLTLSPPKYLMLCVKISHCCPMLFRAVPQHGMLCCAPLQSSTNPILPAYARTGPSR
jgi:hypothetical protein